MCVRVLFDFRDFIFVLDFVREFKVLQFSHGIREIALIAEKESKIGKLVVLIWLMMIFC